MITGEDIGSIVKLNGIVSKIGKPYVRITYGRFECPSCGSIIGVKQQDRKLKEPSRCSCGRRGGFKMFEHDQAEGQDIYVLEKGTDFGYIVYLEEKMLIRKLTRIQEECAVEIMGMVQLQFANNSAVGDLVLFATRLSQTKKKKR